MLSDSSAYAIATTWLAPLQGCVQLVVDKDDGPIRSIVESYAWVRITPPTRHYTSLCDLQEEAKERAAIVRAAMTTWVWLSNCAGYSGRANPTFWKRVFSAFQEPASDQSSSSSFARSKCTARPVTDAISLFDQLDHEFPRFMVEVNDLYYNEPHQVDARRIFGITEGSTENAFTPHVAEVIARIRTQLEPFMDHQIMSQRDIDVCITVDTFLMSALYQQSPYTVLTRFVHDVNAQTPPNDPYTAPRLRIVQFLEDGAAAMGSTIHQTGFAQFVRSVPLRYGHFALHQPMRDLTVQDRVQWVSCFCRLDSADVQAQVHSLSFLRHAIDDAMITALFSALPFAQSVKSLTFDTLQFSRRETTDLPWLAYALFHPHAATTSCRHVEWQHAKLNSGTAATLQAMARGNNLLAVLQGTPPRSDAYYSGTLDAGTHIHLEPSSTSEVLCQASNATTRVDICDVSSLDPATWTEWVGVIIPGYGLGWVRSRQLHDIRADAPSVGSLSGLTLHSGRSRSLKAMVRVFALLGAGLTYLDIGAYAETDATALAGILGACPSLKVLKVCYNDVEGRNPSETQQARCELDELELIVPDEATGIELLGAASLASSLGRLLALRISACRNHLLQASGPVIEQVLSKAKSLQYFHWKNSSSKAATASISYTASQAQTQELLEELQLPNHLRPLAQDVSTSTAAVSFLSVARATDTTTVSALACVVTNRDLLTTVLQFAKRPALRTICIEPDQIPVSVRAKETTWREWLTSSLRAMLRTT